MALSEGASTGLAIIAWFVAGSLAAGLGGAVFGIAAYRRSREAEGRLRRLEHAVGEFCSALRARVALEQGCRYSSEAPREQPAGKTEEAT